MGIAKLIKKLSIAKNTNEINVLLSEVLALYGIKSFAFVYYDQFPTSQHPIQYDYASAPLRVWHEYYLATQFEDTDQTLQWAKRMILPIHWDVQGQAEVAKTPKELRLRTESLENGIRQGYSLPIHGPQDDFASLTIHEREGEDCFRDIEAHLHEIHIVGYYYYAQLKKILRREKTPHREFNLTAREYQCLRLTKENFLADKIAELIHISPRTVHFHIQNAIKKLGVRNKYQACLLLD